MGRFFICLKGKLKRKWVKIRVRPIHVYCLHHVCEEFSSKSMCQTDWMQLDEFKHKVLEMKKEGVEFISLVNAYGRIRSDFIRMKTYAVLTFDDGYASLNEVLPWLLEQKIPTTLFITGKYLDGDSFRQNPTEKYLTESELREISLNYDGLISIGHHGWEHNDASKMSQIEFEESINNNISILSSIPGYIPFWAYTWGKHAHMTDLILMKHSVIPVLIDGMKNYDNRDDRDMSIHRELL